MSAERPLVQGVNIPLGDEMSELFYEASKETRANRPECLNLDSDSFEGTALIAGRYFARNIMDISFGHELDGIGTKPEISERLNDHLGSASDLFAMVGDDVVTRGGEIITIDTLLDVRQLNAESDVIMTGMRALASGMVRAAKESGAIVTTGEIAELGRRIGGYGDFNYNWGGVAWYAINNCRQFTGKELQPGQKLVGLAEDGFRSNGISDVRRIMLENYGENWHEQTEQSLGNVALGKLVQTPSKIYASCVTSLQGGFDMSINPKANITGVAHITGGGQPSKLGRMLARAPGLGARIDTPIDPPAIMLHTQRIGGMSDNDAYKKWHMGPGMILATTEPEKVIAEVQRYGIRAKTIGEITDQPGIRIQNRGGIGQQQWLVF